MFLLSSPKMMGLRNHGNTELTEYTEKNYLDSFSDFSAFRTSVI